MEKKKKMFLIQFTGVKTAFRQPLSQYIWEYLRCYGMPL